VPKREIDQREKARKEARANARLRAQERMETDSPTRERHEKYCPECAALTERASATFEEQIAASEYEPSWVVEGLVVMRDPTLGQGAVVNFGN
jgi:hypothetical protein